MPRHFTREHISHFTKLMALYSQNDGLLCKVFSSIIVPTMMRWFNELEKNFIHSFWGLIQVFRARFVTCSRVLHPIESLLSMTMGIAETLRSYSDRYWELYNEIEGSNEQVATSTFKLGLSYDFKLRESLTKQPHEDMHQLMRHIEEYRGWRMTGCRTGKRLRSCLTIGRRLEGGYINKGLKGRFLRGGGKS